MAKRNKGQVQCLPNLDEVAEILVKLAKSHELELENLRLQLGALQLRNKELATQYWDADVEPSLLAEPLADTQPACVGCSKYIASTAAEPGLFADDILQDSNSPAAFDGLHLSESTMKGQKEQSADGWQVQGSQSLTSSFQLSEKSVAIAPRSRTEEIPTKNVWTNILRSTSRHRRLGPQQSNANLHLVTDLGNSTPKSRQTSRSWVIRNPSAKTHLSWEIFGACLILFDSILIPLSVFDPPPSTFMLVYDWFSLIFWSLNVLETLTVGYVRKGVVVKTPRKILSRYLTSWFVVDLIVLVPDWIFSLADPSGAMEGGSADSSESFKLLRMFRMIKTVRLLRLAKMPWLLDTINDLCDSEATSIIGSIVRMVVLLLVINHFLACAWFLVASLSEEYSGTSWIHYHGYSSVDWSYQYLIAAHWSITQFTPASMHVQPQNPAERAFAFVVVVLALVGFSYVVGSITGSLAQLRSMSEQGSKEFWKLRRFLRRNDVPFELAMRVRRYVEHDYNKHKELAPIGEVSMMKFCSEQLKFELMHSINGECLEVHPLFAFMRREHLPMIQRLCAKAIERRHLSKGEQLFLPDEKALYTVFIEKGQLAHKKVNAANSKVSVLIPGTDWLAEPTLWSSDWHHIGCAFALQDVTVLNVSADIFETTANSNASAHEMLHKYALGYMAWLNSISYEELSDFQDHQDYHLAACEFAPELFDHQTRTGYFHFRSSSVLSNLFSLGRSE